LVGLLLLIRWFYLLIWIVVVVTPVVYLAYLNRVPVHHGALNGWTLLVLAGAGIYLPEGT